jgi:ubiquinone/menaquinone biosynthesis C-methylase UbiE
MAERHPIFAALYDPSMLVQNWLAFGHHRALTASAAVGRVLEVGIGTGLNLHLYRAATSIVGVEPDPGMLARARRRAAAHAETPVHLLAARGEHLPLPSASVDSVVATLVFCTIPDVHLTLREVGRVLRPGGNLHFFEHVRATRPWLARLQDRALPLWQRLFAGCHPNRDTLAAFHEAGFRVEALWRSRSGVLVRGTARPTGCAR